MTQTISPPRSPAVDDARPPSSARSGLMLLVGIAVFTVVGIRAGWGVYIGFAAIFALVIMLHEAGHFVAAKAGGMKVTQFFVGFGPSIWSFHRGETEYGVKALPLGGYVRIIGMHNLDKVDPVDEPRSYRQASFPKRLAVAGAGSFVHAVIAFVLLVVLFGPLGRVIARPSTTIDEVSRQLTLEHPEPTTVPAPAFAAGLRAGDKIVAINGVAMADWATIALTLQGAPGRRLQIEIERAGTVRTISVVPASVRTEDGSVVGRVGILPAAGPIVIDRRGLPGAVGGALSTERSLIADTVQSFGSFFGISNLRSYSDELARAGSGRDPAVAPEEQNRFVSPVGAAKIADDLYRLGGVRSLLWLLVIINVSVGVLNMIPLLPFDGGHVAIAVYERVRSRRGRRHRVDVVKLMPLTYAVVTILILIGVSSMYLDVVRPASINDEPRSPAVTSSTGPPATELPATEPTTRPGR